ncbi:hypothetical protein VYU27_004110 [Nannochloropsis oceanica]
MPSPVIASLMALAVMAVDQASAQVDSYLSEADMQRYQGIANAGMASNTPEAIYFGTKLSKALGGNISGVCATASEMIVGAPGDLAAVGYGLGALREGGCEVSLDGAASQVTATLKAGWKAENGLFESKWLVLMADSALGGGKVLENMDAAMKNLNKHRSEDGFVRASLEEKMGGSTDGTFLLLEAVAATKVTSKGIKKTLDKATQLLPGAGEGVEGGADPGADATLLPVLVKALAALGEEGLSMTSEQGGLIAKQLLKMKGTGSAKGAYKVLTALQTLVGSFADAAPVAVVLSMPVIKVGDGLKVDVRTLLGKPAEGTYGNVEVEKVGVGAAQEVESMAGQVLKTSGRSGTFEGTTAGLEMGLYDVVLKVGEKLEGVKRSLVVQGEAKLTNVEVGVSPTRAHSDGRIYPAPLRAGEVKASSVEGEYISASFTVESTMAPQQAFLKLTHLDTGSEAIYAAKRGGGTADAWAFIAVVSLVDDVEFVFGHRSGEYQLSLLVGDVSLEMPSEQDLGTMSLAFPPKPKAHYALYRKPLQWDSDTALAPLPEIYHQFRRPEKRPNPVLPAAFTTLIALALAMFLIYLPRVGANLDGLPSAGAALVWNVAWVGCLCAVILLFTAYWVHLKGMTTLKLLLPLGLTTVLVGHRAFVSKNLAFSSATPGN